MSIFNMLFNVLKTSITKETPKSNTAIHESELKSQDFKKEKIIEVKAESISVISLIFMLISNLTTSDKGQKAIVQEDMPELRGFII